VSNLWVVVRRIVAGLKQEKPPVSPSRLTGGTSSQKCHVWHNVNLQHSGCQIQVLGYSKKLENLRHAVALFVWHFKFR